MSPAIPAVLMALVCAIGAGPAPAREVLDFEGLKNFEGINTYYSGGLGSLGSGPGPDFGITFSSTALGYIHGQQSGTVSPFPGDPSPPTVLLLWNLGHGVGAGQPLSTTMDVAGGFTQGLAFSYLAIGRDASVQVYSGPDATGTLLASDLLPMTGTKAANAVFSLDTIAFSGIAHSVVFRGGNDQLALDDITLTAASATPEPSSWIPLATGLGCSYLVFAHRKRKAAAR